MSDRVNLVAPASPVHRASYSTNGDRKGGPGSEIQMYYGCPWKWVCEMYTLHNYCVSCSVDCHQSQFWLEIVFLFNSFMGLTFTVSVVYTVNCTVPVHTANNQVFV